MLRALVCARPLSLWARKASVTRKMTVTLARQPGLARFSLKQSRSGLALASLTTSGALSTTYGRSCLLSRPASPRPPAVGFRSLHRDRALARCRRTRGLARLAVTIGRRHRRARLSTSRGTFELHEQRQHERRQLRCARAPTAGLQGCAHALSRAFECGVVSAWHCFLQPR